MKRLTQQLLENPKIRLTGRGSFMAKLQPETYWSNFIKHFVTAKRQ